MPISKAMHEISNVVRAQFAIFLLAVMMSSSTRAEPASDYLLAPGDTIKLDILDDAEIPVDLPVGPDGTIQAPLVGGVRVAGLTLSDAAKELERSYVEQRIFVVPKLGVSVAAYRPIFVIGDVRQPGSYPFLPQLTVEKAMGLSGGQLQAAPSENPVLASARLRQQLDTVEADIIREAFASARAKAQLAGRTTILEEDVPEAARSYVKGPAADTIRDVQLRILTAAAESFTSETAVLTEQLAEAERGLALLNELLQNATGIIEFARADLKRAQDLQARGIKTLTDVSNLMRQTSMEEARQLQVLADLSEARRGIGELKSKLADLEKTRTMDALVELESHSAGLTKALSSRRGAEEQLILMSTLTAEDLAENKEVVLDFTIRRRTDGTQAEMKAAPDTFLLPGDVLVVRMRGSDEVSDVTSSPGVAASIPGQ